MKQFRLMLLAEEERISLKVLVIPQHHVARLQLLDKIRVASFLNLLDSLTYQTHIFSAFLWSPLQTVPRLLARGSSIFPGEADGVHGVPGIGMGTDGGGKLRGEDRTAHHHPAIRRLPAQQRNGSLHGWNRGGHQC